MSAAGRSGSGGRAGRGARAGRGLGRGLDLLISREAREAPVSRAGASRVPLEAIAINPEQPRRVFDEAELAELTASVQRFGIISPLLVRRAGRGYILIAGERRLRAARAAGLTEVPVLLREDADEAVLQLELALVENLQRADLSAIDAALGYQRLIDEFGHSQEAVATAVGKDRSTIANAVRLLRLPAEVLQAVRAGALSAGHARALLPLIGQDGEPVAGFDEAVQAASELSVRATERLVKQLLAGRSAAEQRSARQARLQAAAPVAERLASVLAAEVLIRPRKRGGGRIVIDYDSADELDRLVEQLGGGSDGEA